MNAASYERLAVQVQAIVEKAKSVTVVTHINPDADTLGTGLGIFSILKRTLSVPVEIVNVSNDLPNNLDFLPHFKHIKHKSDFDDLVIACDGAEKTRFGLDLHHRPIVNVDHHYTNTRFGDVNIIDETAASSGEVGFELFRRIYTISSEAAQCFYTALFSDTRHFTSSDVNALTFQRAGMLIESGANPSLSAFHLTQRKSLASLRLLQRALASLRLYRDATVGVMILLAEDFKATGARMSDLDGIVDFAKSLATVEIGVLISQMEDGKVRVSLRSKHTDVSKIAQELGGGGHRQAAGVIVDNVEAQAILDTILRIIEETERENEKKKK